ncbi:MAG: hypothetical protein NC182_04145 [Prevotella sp.]|nr:hypothetical protein [Staphylococcus sp.]MCM1350372.1 hypothetical protein [Prevotella sp.]
MKVLATKSTKIGFLYIFCLVMGVIFSLFSFYMIYFLLVGILLVLVSLGIVIDYFHTAKAPILLNDKNQLILSKGIILELNEVKDVSYRRASAKGIQYKWGTVKIISTKGEFKFRYLENCEEVAKTILKLVYQFKE